jgi:glucose/arabinose dehydrogenase
MKPVVVLLLSAAVTLSGNPAFAQKITVLKSADYTLSVTELQSGLQSPWGMAFLPDRRLLVTRKSGQLLIVSADGKRIQATLGNLPAVAKQGQGGLLDVALDPGFANNGLVYWSYAEPGTGKEKGLSGTAVARGRLHDDALQAIQVIYRQKPKVQGSGHFGSRLAFARDKTLFITLGDRQKSTPAQDMAQSLGKVVRINRDGSPPEDNPGWLHARALPEIYSLGHRNPQGAALHPLNGELWISEHGPQGGDEINRVLPGRNYGWPTASYGCNYGEPVGEECRLGGGRHAPKYIEPSSIWVPVSVAPSNFIFYSGRAFPKWQGHVLMGALAGTALWRVQFSGIREVKRERLLAELGERIRDVEQGPDGLLYLLTDSGKLLRLDRLR